MKNKKWLIWAVVALVLGIGLWYYFKKSEAIKIELTTVKPEMGDITESITATGTIQPVDTVAVGTQVSGTISRIFVDFNTQVKKGQLLATLDPALLKDQSLQIAGNLSNAKSNLPSSNLCSKVSMYACCNNKLSISKSLKTSKSS